MYELCKKQIELKIKKGTLTKDYAVNMKKNLGIFKLADEISDSEYLELIAVINENLEEI